MAPLKLYDKQIRPLVREYISKTFDPRISFTKEEFRLTDGFTITDIVVVDKNRLVGFEIKGDRDNLSRLKRQSTISSHTYEECYLVSTEKHLEAALEIIPEWWGVFVVSNDGSTVFMSKYRGCSPNYSVPPMALLQLLKVSEVKDIMRFLNLNGYSSKSSSELYLELHDSISQEDLSVLSCMKLKARYQARNLQKTPKNKVF